MFDVIGTQLRVVERTMAYPWGSVRTHAWPHAGPVYGVGTMRTTNEHFTSDDHYSLVKKNSMGFFAATFV